MAFQALFRPLQHVWCLPVTLGAFAVMGALVVGCALWRRLRGLKPGGGLALALARSQRQPLAFWLTSPSISHLLTHHPAGPMEAAVTGHIVWACQPWEATPAHIRAHELAHVRQSLRWGALFPLAYLASSWLAKRRGLDPYLDNAFEVEAHAAETE